MSRLRRRKLSELLASGIASVCVLGALGNVASQVRSLARDNLLTRYRFNAVDYHWHKAEGLLRMLRTGSAIPLVTALSPGPRPDARTGFGASAALVRSLQTFADLPQSERRRIGAVVPRTEVDFFWGNVVQASSDAVLPSCASAAFLIPATAGIPLLDGLPPGGCDAKAYAYQYYPRLPEREWFWRHTFRDWCARGSVFGIDRLAVITLQGRVGATITGFECEGASHAAEATVVAVSLRGDWTASASPDDTGSVRRGDSVFSFASSRERARRPVKEHVLRLAIEMRSARPRLLIPVRADEDAASFDLRVQAPDGLDLALLRLPVQTRGWVDWIVDLPQGTYAVTLIATRRDSPLAQDFRIGAPRERSWDRPLWVHSAP